MKYSKIEGVLGWSAGNLLMRKGMSFDDAHPLVAERPDLFTDVAPGADMKSPSSVAAQVQTNMQRPGEARTERPPVVKAPPRHA